MKTLLIGFGDLAQRLQPLLPGDIVAIRRSPRPEPFCRQLDALDAAAMGALLEQRFDQIVVTLTPSERSDEGYRRAYVEPMALLVELLAQRQLRPRILFVSSTAVYGQNQGEWLDETSIVAPSQFNGVRLLEAEGILLNAGLEVIIARFSGIYGPGRARLVEQVRHGIPISRNLLAYSNRIHVDDGASAVAHLLQLEAPESHYLVTDSEPVLLGEVVRALATALQRPAPSASAGAPFSGKRLRNTRLLASGFRFRYPSWREGYGLDKLQPS
ncbi:NAD-dependent epimerase/dehydratase family protein [Simiduia curdlanivorans]|uniref:NAD-dependent epimerase/dehydratase family protein n=1 Tax=Simiduia curdlanivorans TaxID=1492769 RepID=A0ABV8V1F7_9GAMM|nr:NAD-dependent epimerase/dehydratase family protein [Simiduia curdlanivorans]MDN3637940.1 NAD-dependent epimerase/dehydratase family protein [Simiduia curdlanivorans]